MKKINRNRFMLAALFAVIVIAVGVCFSGCGEHSHSFTEEMVKEEYLRSSATCASRAVYYKTCVCGEKGKTTFFYGETLPHDYVTRADVRYLVSDASCTEKAVYYLSCSVCGLRSNETFSSGEFLAHEFDCEAEDEIYLRSSGSCSEKKTFYKSCKCGLCSNSDDHVFTGSSFGEHPIEEEWSKNNLYHWHCVTCAHTDEIMDMAEHTFSESYRGGEYCAVCDYKKTSFSFALSEDGLSYSVTGRGDVTEADIVIPSTFNGKPIKQIAPDAFEEDTALTSVIVESCLDSVGSAAFYGCTALTYVKLNGVTQLNYGAFELCAELRNVEIAGIDFVGAYAFSECACLESVILSDTLRSIGDGAFLGCASLKDLTFKGTKAQWALVTLGSEWNGEGKFTVHCSDGDVILTE